VRKEMEVKKGDKVKIFRAGFWFATGEVVSVQNEIATVVYKGAFGVWHTLKGHVRHLSVIKEEGGC